MRGSLVGPLWALALVLLGLAFWPGLEQPGKVPREALLLVAAPLLLAVSLRTTRTRPAGAFLMPFGVAVACGLLGVFFVTRPEWFTVLRDLSVLAAPWAVAIAACLHEDDGDEGGLDASIELGAVALLISLSLLGLAQGWSGVTLVAQDRPPAATFVNRNVAAQSLVVLLPLAVPLLLAARRGWLRWVSAGAVGLGLAFLIATRTRGAWIGLLFGIALGIVVWIRSGGRSSARSYRPWILVGALGLLALFVPVQGTGRLLPSVGQSVATLGEAVEGSGSNAIRRALWRNTLVMVGESPAVGAGAGRFAAEYPAYQAAVVPTPGFGAQFQAEHAHGDALEFAAELGLPATAALYFVLLGAVVLCFGRSAATPSALTAARRASRAAVIGGALVHGLVSFSLHSPASAFVVWFVVGRCWAVVGRQRTGTTASWILAGLVLAAVLPSAWLGVREIRSHSALHRALDAVGRGDCPRALEAAGEVPRHAAWDRRGVGMAAMVVFECDPDPERSLRALEGALEIHPNQPNLLLAVGARRLKSGDAPRSEAVFRRAVEIVPLHGRAWLGLAMAQLAGGDRETAAGSCRTAVRLAPPAGPTRDFCRGNGLLGP